MIIKVGKRMRFYYRITAIKKVRHGTWEVDTNYGVEGPFIIEGGKHLGGTRRDWFLSHPSWRKSINATSLIDALHILDNM
jgi:hypothetical protein